MTHARGALSCCSPGAFLCNETNSGSNGTNFSCVDPNTHWPGDYLCTCAFDKLVPYGGYTPGIAQQCGTDVIFEDAHS